MAVVTTFNTKIIQWLYFLFMKKVLQINGLGVGDRAEATNGLGEFSEATELLCILIVVVIT